MDTLKGKTLDQLLVLYGNACRLNDREALTIKAYILERFSLNLSYGKEAEIKTLAFGEGLLDVSIDGTKDITIRKFRPEAHTFKKDEVVMGIFADGFNILISMKEDTQTKSFKDLTDEEARGSGYNNAEDALLGLKEFYEGLQPNDTAAIIRYEILRVYGIPVIQFPSNKEE